MFDEFNDLETISNLVQVSYYETSPKDLLTPDSHLLSLRRFPLIPEILSKHDEIEVKIYSLSTMFCILTVFVDVRRNYWNHI